ncbi:MAG: YedE-related selenium metabolism membrane protein [Phycisphaerae bacterium]|nr:YedE-related selenium metabolism membrane protein [Phycisphaerae bacterium]
MKTPRDFFATPLGIIVVGLAIGTLAATLQKLGNPANMGICVACFTRDIAGALGLHRAAVVQYLRPEIPAFCLGSFIAALIFREFRPRTGSSPVIRFVLGMFAMIGALVFLGCPWRAMLRLAGGDWTAIVGIIGLIVGITIGVRFLQMGFSLGRSYPTRVVTGLAMPFVMLALLLLAIFHPHFSGESGPGAAAAPVVWSIIIGLGIGFAAQRTRFCTVGGLRDIILMRDFHLASGVVAFLVAAFILNLVFKQFHPGWSGQPASHTNVWLNFGGMALAGLSFTLAGGCPGRQVFLSGEGDGDAAIFVLGMLTGAAVAHNFLMVGTQSTAPTIVIIGLITVGLIGWLGIERLSPAR